jgi:lipoprotein-anchoring transpeptidase ErfK/SrfK
MMLKWKAHFLAFLSVLLIFSCAGNNEDQELTDILTPDEIAEDVNQSGDPGDNLDELPTDPEAKEESSEDNPIADSEDDVEEEKQPSVADQDAEPGADQETPPVADAEPKVEPKHPVEKEIQVDPKLPNFLLTHAQRSKFVVVVKKSEQKAYWIEKGKLTNNYEISSGTPKDDTPVGIYSITRMHYKYTSKKYKARMDRAIFFHGGYALHATYGKNIKILGPRDDKHQGYGHSHGCVRQSPDDADDLYSRVKFHGARNVTIVVMK